MSMRYLGFELSRHFFSNDEKEGMIIFEVGVVMMKTCSKVMFSKLARMELNQCNSDDNV